MNYNQCYSPVFGQGPAIPWSIPFAAAYAPPPTAMDAYLTGSLPTLDSIQRPFHSQANSIASSMIYQDIIVEHVPDAFFADTSTLDTINELRVEDMRRRFAGAIGRTKKLLRPPNPYVFFNWDQRCAFKATSTKWKNLPESERIFYTKTWRSFHKAFPDHFGTSPLKRKKSGAPRKSGGKPPRKTNRIQEEAHLGTSGTGGGGDYPNIQAQLLGIIESTE